MWQGENIEIYEKLKQQAVRLNKQIPEFIKEIIERQVRQSGDS
ncbi:hypothetical protein [Nostoc sp.]